MALISPALYAKLDAGPGVRKRSVALVINQGDEPPPSPTCAADLKAGLERQLRQLGERAQIDLRLTSDVAEAAVVFLVGDTINAARAKALPAPAWLRAAREGTPGATSEFSSNFSFPHFDSTDYLEGVFTDRDDRMIFGVSLIHWAAVRGGADGKACAFNFVERLAILYSLALDEEFASLVGKVGRETRTRVGPRAYEVPDVDDSGFMLGAYFCAQLADRTKLAACASQVVKLIEESKP